MPDLLVRNLKPETVAYLKDRARLNRRSVSAEVALILEDAAGREPNPHAEFWEWSRRFLRETEGTYQSDSADLIREDRDTVHGRDW